MWRKASRYGNRKTVYNGNTYDSMKEARYARDLDMRLRAQDIRGWERQVPIPLEAYGKKICSYIVDFVVMHKNGQKEYVEVKGFKTAVFRLKWKMFEAKMEETDPKSLRTIV